MDTKQKLDLLAEWQAKRTLLEMDKAKAIDSVMTPDIKQALKDIESEYATKYEGVDANIAAITEQVKAEVVAGGESVKGSYLHAVYAKGRVSWDSKKLDGLILVLPQLADARKEGEPSVSIRKI